MKVAVYPGTFDPITNGHLDIIERTAKLFTKVVIGVAAETYKNNLFSFEERIAMVNSCIGHLPNVTVEGFCGLLMDFVHQKKAIAIIRGLRAVSDFEYEFQLSMMNKMLDEKVETLFLMTAKEYSFISSSIIKSVASLGGSIAGLVPPGVEQTVARKYLNNNVGTPMFRD